MTAAWCAPFDFRRGHVVDLFHQLDGVLDLFGVELDEESCVRVAVALMVACICGPLTL